MKFSEEPEKTIEQTLEGQEEHLGRSEVHLGNPEPLQEDPNKLSAVVASSANYQAKTTAPSSTVFESTTAHTLEGQGEHPGRSGVHLGNPQPHQEDSNKSSASEASPANYQAKTIDPLSTGGAEAHVNPITHSFQEMKFSEEPEKTTAQTLEGQGDHLINPQPLQEDPNQLSVVVDSPANYQAKTTSPLSKGEAEAHVSPHSIQEMEVYEEPEKTEDSPRGSHDQFSPTSPPSEPTPTQEKPEPSAASTVSEVVTGETAQGPEENGVSVKDYLVGKLSPGEEDKALSEVISEAMQRREEGEPLVGTEGVVETENGVVRKEEGVVGKIVGAVTSLFKKGETGQQGQGEINHEDTEGRRLQESGN
ncbi:Low-temperature-induced 65 kDa protein [Acorus gramineus]|uniref:Low-temperature-induced 65 kDa protein n=1 Tax=Acorus gramineus TaxID=55184 RepID=A0AAV8ZWW6_ACOGR|nr:Low-temperature-induced 65 kDa protein [Acorus gramineus]